VVELVDTQVSGICARKGVGVRIPPFALYILSFVLMSSMSLGCGKKAGEDKYTSASMHEKAADRVNEISEGALDVLEQHAAKQDEAIDALRKYSSENLEEMLGLRRYFRIVRERVSAADIAPLDEKMKKDREPLNVRAETLLKTFDDPMAVRRVLQLIY
tara:strand:+ start:90 stop:566 length:477 start_codon:yes stop_codon:yes gene_type:complete